MKRLILICYLSFVICHTGTCQVPVTVDRNTSTNGFALPPLVGTSSAPPPGYSWNYPASGFGGACSSSSTNFSYVGGLANGNPGTINAGTPVTVTGSPYVKLLPGIPSGSTNSVTATAYYSDQNHNTLGVSFSQTYLIFISDGSSGDGGTTFPIVTLTGMGDSLQSISRRDPSSDYRKMLGFQLKANTNTVLQSLAVALSNTTTNSPPDSNFSGIQLYQDDGDQEWNAADNILATSTNASGFAIFDHLSIPLNSTRRTFFVAASFSPTNQTRSSFITASLRSQNLLVILSGTNSVIEVTGGTLLGKQYAFLDPTQAEADAAASALNTQIQSSVDAATNALTVAYNNQLATELANAANRSAEDLATATNALAVTYAADMAAVTNRFSSQISTLQQQIQTGNDNSASSRSEPSLTSTILPAAAAGAAAIGAAFTSDSLGKPATSREYSLPH